jgi:proteasome activator subunit 4
VQDGPISIILPKLHELIDDQKTSHSQRAAAELVAGMIRGSKHWNSLQLTRLERDIYPLFFKAYNNSSAETVHYWRRVISFIGEGRDPNRLQKLIGPILDISFDINNTSFLGESKKVWLKGALTWSFKYRFRSSNAKVLNELVDMVATPYQQIRDIYGDLFDSCIQLGVSRPLSTLDQVLERNESWEREELHLLPLAPQVLQIFEKLSEYKKLPFVIGSSSLYGNTCKTALAWFMTTITYYEAVGTCNMLNHALELILDVQDLSDVEITAVAQKVARIYPNYLQGPQQLIQSIDLLIRLCATSAEEDGNEQEKSQSWHMKMRVLPILQVLYYRHIFYLENKSKAKIFGFLELLLNDSQIEVRKLASVTLSGLIQCAEREMIPSLIVCVFDGPGLLS